MNFYIETIRRNYLVMSSSICVYVCQLHTKHRLSTVHNSLFRLRRFGVCRYVGLLVFICFIGLGGGHVVSNGSELTEQGQEGGG